ncbi:hypothetical protein CYMTET_3932 [Cymbomonas tetramitiformis]|uniref:CCHC-type domain-containing protein n=1 Tax=Cymbomonas tetramitiformis TaxID=36881 RepID=A0AAE0H2E9_9CHLO|nr:hypothetical protein CYMTET_3932 [Cymbomonas tetramitiformis]
MSRYKDPANEPQAPEAEYTEDSPPMVFVDPDADSVPAPAPPPSLVPKVKMTPPREFKSGQDAEVWLDTVDRYFQFTYPDVNDKDLITVFLTLIQNNDRHYFQVLAKQPYTTYAMVRQTFLRQFGNPHKRSVAKKHLMALTQGTQTFADYLRTFTSLASLAAVDLNDVLIKDRFVTSMDPDLRRQFQLRYLTEEQRNNLSWQETTQVLLDLNYVIHSKQSETLHYRGQKEQSSGGPAKKEKDRGRGQKPYDRFNRNRNQNQSGSQNSNQNRNKGKGGKGKGKGKGKSQNDKTCNRCGRPGHIEKDCFATRTNDGKEIKGKPPAQSPYQNRRQQQQNQGAKDGSGKLINTINTLVKELKSQHSINAAVATPAPVPSAPAPQGNSQGTAQFQQMDTPSEHIAQMQSQTAQLKSQKKLLLYKGKVYGQSTHILVDPGATSSFIDRQFAAQLGIAPTDSSSFSVGLAGGSQLPCTSYLPKATFSLGKYKDAEDFYIIDMKPFTVILGQDWLERRNPHIDFQTKNLTITRKHSSGSSIRTVLSRVEQTPDSDDLPEMELVSATTMRKHLRRIRSSGSAEEAVAYLFFLSEVDGELVFTASDTDTTMEDPEVTAARDQVREDFSDIFQEDLPAGHRPERFEGGYHRINIEPGHKPPSQPVRTIPVPMMEELKRQIIKYVELGILRPSSSPYGCPIIFAPKPGGKWRMCCDYRALNNITIKDTYPLPPHDTLLEQLKGARWFSRFDFNQFSHQIPIHPDDIHKTAIRTRYGSYEWTVMPFGLTNAPATALRVGNRAFFDFIDQFLVIFMDDTIVYSPDFDSHVTHVRQFLQRCRDHHFFIRPSKVELFVRSIDFIGHHISEAGLSIIEDRIRAVMAIQPPVSYGPTVGKQPLRRMAKDGKSSLRSFLGMVGQFRRFIPKFSKVAEPLNRLLKDNAEFVWESEQQQAFDNLKSAICNAPVLQLPDQKLPSIMEVDGSGTHVGQVILQDQGKGMKPCGYHSVTLSDTQRRWPIPEIELFAIVEGFRFFRHILLGAPETIVRSDHQPLVYFQSKSTLSPKQARWLDELSEYNFRIEHIAGDKNKVADALTRISALFELTDCLQHMDISEVMPSADPTFIALISSSSAHQLHDIIISEYDRDTFAQTILAKLTSSTSSQSVSSFSFELIQGLIYRKTIYGRQLYIPPTAKVPTDDGYGPEHDTWVKATELTNAADIIAAYEG